MEVKIFAENDDILGEAPYWDDGLKELFWVDIERKLLLRKGFNTELPSYQLPEAITSFYINGSTVFGCSESGFCSFNLDSQEFKVLVEIEADIKSNRSNDGALDGMGGFVFGTMCRAGNQASGSIYYVDIDTLFTQTLDAGYFIPNGFAFINEGSRLLVADSFHGKIFSYDYDRVNKEVKNRELFSDVSGNQVNRDGMAVSDINIIWNAEWGGHSISCYDFEGIAKERLKIPALNPSSCAVGGDDMHVLFVTTDKEGMSAKQLKEYPLSGCVLYFNLNDDPRI